MGVAIGTNSRYQCFHPAAEMARTDEGIFAELTKNGAVIGAHDLLIAASALAHGYPVLLRLIETDLVFFGTAPYPATRSCSATLAKSANCANDSVSPRAVADTPTFAICSGDTKSFNALRRVLRRCMNARLTIVANNG